MYYTFFALAILFALEAMNAAYTEARHRTLALSLMTPAETLALARRIVADSDEVREAMTKAVWKGVSMAGDAVDNIMSAIRGDGK